MATKTVILRPGAIISSTNWSWNVGTLLAAIDPGDPISHDDDTTYAGIVEPAVNGLFASLTNVPGDILQVVSVTPMGRPRAVLGTADVRLGVQLTGTSSYTSAATVIGSYSNEGAAVSRPGGGAWLPSDIAESTFYVILDPVSYDTGGDELRLTSLWVSLEYEPIPAQDDGARDAASRRQWFFMTRPPVIERALRVQDALKADLMDLVAVSHRDGPHASGEGWRSKNWQREPHRIVSRRTDPNTDIVRDGMRSVREQLCLLRFTARAKSPAAIADGMGFFSAGSEIEFSRDSVAWVADPSANGTSLVRVDKDQPKYGLSIQDASGDSESGLIHEDATDQSNTLPHSSFRNGLTGWTTSPGSGTITAATSPLLFDSAESPNVLKIVAGSPHSTRSTATSSAATANSQVSVQVWHRTAAGATAGPGIVIQRASDSQYYNASTGFWGATRAVNATAASDDWRETVYQTFNAGATTTITVEITVESGVPDASEYYVGHVQVMNAPSALGHIHTPILTEGSAVTPAADALVVTNDSGARCFNEARGALALVAIPLTTVQNTYLDVVHDANNSFTLEHTGAQWRAEWKGGGTTYAATLNVFVSRGVAHRVAVRWTGDDDELGLGARTLDIFVDGVKGTGVTIGTDMTEAATSDLTFGNVTIRDLHFYPYVPTDEEMVRLPRV